MRDVISLDLTAVTDADVRGLLELAEHVAGRGRDGSGLRRVFAGLAVSCRDVLSSRVLVEAAIAADPAMPPSWVAAVAALPLDEPGA
jgi:hypothetical protein